MTIRDAYDYSLVELNKLKASTLLIEDFNYLFNKAIQQYINGVYNRCEYNQQSSDDLMFLQKTIKLTDFTLNEPVQLNDRIWVTLLPEDYFHLLNCIASINYKPINCTSEKTITSPCQRLTADLYSGILNNVYMAPSYTKPYFYISKSDSDITIEIHTGKKESTIDNISVTYLKQPDHISMDYEDTLSVEDTTENLEFPEYVCYEIINLFVRLMMENASDPRLQTNIPLNQTIGIGVPGQQSNK